MSATIEGGALMGSAEWIGTTVMFRLSKSVDPTKRKRHDLRDYIDVLGGESMSDDRAVAVAQGKRVAHILSALAKEKTGLVLEAERVTLAASMLVAAYADLWNQVRLKEAVVVSDDADRSSLKIHILPVIGRLPMVDVKQSHIEKIVDNLDKLIDLGKASGGISWKRAANIWGTLRMMFWDAAHAKTSRGLRILVADPTADVAPPKRGEKRTKAFLYPSEYLTLVTSPAIWQASGRQFQRARHARRWMRLFTLAIYLQMRGGELRVVRWEHVDFDHWVITVKIAAVRGTAGKKEKKTKSGRIRSFAIPPELRPLLLLMKKEAGGDKAQGRIIKVPPESSLSSRLRTYCREAGITREDLYMHNVEQAQLTFHDLRATGITWRAVRDDNPFAIQDAAGHTDLATTQGYIRRAAGLGAAFGVPFPPVPAIVLSDASPDLSEGCSEAAQIPVGPKPGPNPAQEITKPAKRLKKRATPMGIERDLVPKSPVKTRPFGPSGPTDAPDRTGSNRSAGSKTDPVTAALRRALDEAIAAGDAEAAVQIAARLANDAAAPSAIVLPLRRR